MSDESPIQVSQPEWDGGLWKMVLASGGLHLLALALLLVVPYRFIHRPPAMVSYTVDLVAQDRVGGTNVLEGGRGRVEGAPLAAAPAPKVEAPKPPPKAEQPKPPAPKPEAPKPEPVAAKPEPQPAEPPQAEAPPKPNEMTLADKTKATAPAAKPAASPKAVAKAEPPPSPAQGKAPPTAAVDSKAAKQATATRQRDEQIAAAIRRVEQKVGTRGGGSGPAAQQPGAPISVGPGEGTGGMVMGVEYLLYYNQIQSRIKQSWAWAGSNRALHAVVRFNITPAGEVLNVRITQASGDPSYDASVQRAVRAINPLPPPPAAYLKQFSDVEVPFSPEQTDQ